MIKSVYTRFLTVHENGGCNHFPYYPFTYYFSPNINVWEKYINYSFSIVCVFDSQCVETLLVTVDDNLFLFSSNSHNRKPFFFAPNSYIEMNHWVFGTVIVIGILNCC